MNISQKNETRYFHKPQNTAGGDKPPIDTNYMLSPYLWKKPEGCNKAFGKPEKINSRDFLEREQILLRREAENGQDFAHCIRMECSPPPPL